MLRCWEVPEADLNNWVPTARFFAAEDGKYFVIDSDTANPPKWVWAVRRRKTAVFYCTDNAGVIDMNADFEFEEMTTPEEAIQKMGYELLPGKPEGM